MSVCGGGSSPKGLLVLLCSGFMSKTGPGTPWSGFLLCPSPRPFSLLSFKPHFSPCRGHILCPVHPLQPLRCHHGPQCALVNYSKGFVSFLCGKRGRCSHPGQTGQETEPKQLTLPSPHSPPGHWYLPCRPGLLGPGSSSPEDVKACSGHPGTYGHHHCHLSHSSLFCG